MNTTEVIVPLQEVAWLPWAVQYFFFIGLSTTAVLIATAADLGGGERWRRIQPAALLLALSAGVVAPVALLADLHQPGRFWHFYAYFTPWSWMSIGSLLLPLFIGSLFAYGLAWQLQRRKTAGRPRWLAPLAALTALSAVAILVYTGAEVMIVRARPLWHTYWLPLNFALTAMVGSLGTLLFLLRWTGRAGLEDYRFVNQLQWLTLMVTALSALGWALGGWSLGAASFQEALRLYAGFEHWRTLFIGSGLAGLVMLLATTLILRRAGWPAHSWWLAPLAVLSAWSFRWVVFINVQTVPKYGAGLYPYELPLGSDGLLGIVATFGLWVAVLVILTTLANWSVGTQPVRAGAAVTSAPEIAHG